MDNTKASNGPHQKASAAGKAAKQQQAQALKAIAAVADVDQARTQWLELRNQVASIDSRLSELSAQGKAEDKARSTAADLQDYPTAQKHKEKKDEVDAETAKLRADKPALVELRDAAMERFSDLFFTPARHRRMGTEHVTVSLARVYDPDSEESDSAAYLNDDDTIQVTIGGATFDNDASRLKRWATEKGFLVRISSQSVSL